MNVFWCWVLVQKDLTAKTEKMIWEIGSCGLLSRLYMLVVFVFKSAIVWFNICFNITDIRDMLPWPCISVNVSNFCKFNCSFDLRGRQFTPTTHYHPDCIYKSGLAHNCVSCRNDENPLSSLVALIPLHAHWSCTVQYMHQQIRQTWSTSPNVFFMRLISECEEVERQRGSKGADGRNVSHPRVLCRLRLHDRVDVRVCVSVRTHTCFCNKHWAVSLRGNEPWQLRVAPTCRADDYRSRCCECVFFLFYEQHACLSLLHLQKTLYFYPCNPSRDFFSLD